MIQEYLSQKDFTEILQNATLPEVLLAAYTQELFNALCRSELATVSLRSLPYEVGFKQNFNLILNHDASLIKTTVRHLLVYCSLIKAIKLCLIFINKD
ncbi:hypothetical protein BDF20DRAFT_818527 [Mycotypha africana]|uniref:uncharacterized protein n=1 Tax=Mycotypha africana TaxID=64632 RepID=UPI002300D929|nr:uncharacterized protein BDF20DRAFT_818527 [Mycotypha africana]KAI8982100.1 hypothetical protein BDF20DRAFT_818527 [Mycotypha africana]